MKIYSSITTTFIFVSRAGDGNPHARKRLPCKPIWQDHFDQLGQDGNDEGTFYSQQKVQKRERERSRRLFHMGKGVKVLVIMI